jgi:hypothetical protein
MISIWKSGVPLFPSVGAKSATSSLLREKWAKKRFSGLHYGAWKKLEGRRWATMKTRGRQKSRTLHRQESSGLDEATAHTLKHKINQSISGESGRKKADLSALVSADWILKERKRAS